MSDENDSGLEALMELQEGLERLSENLGKLNNRYPATQAFLKKNGVASVNDLDRGGSNRTARSPRRCAQAHLG